ncbi:MAG TPA: DUF4394 domain-containing protein [Fimbriimonadaceae bacterium]|nr:DUF4394 domain-containing protein [Fimbriimonadaceae bacterium]HRJ97142.1 DUF4394 domain-containing protein [Fimbriimonadaceae bacterium]
MHAITRFGFVSFALVSAALARAELIYGVTVNNRLVSFDSATPGSLLSDNPIVGLGAGEIALGIDTRPATGGLYLLGSGNRLYTVTSGGVAMPVGAGFAPGVTGVDYGFDFNPTVDRIRVTNDADENRRLHPITGVSVAVDGNLNYVAGDPNFGRNPNIVGSAYTNNFAGATTTTLYNIDSDLDILVTQIPPNAGGLNTVGMLGIDTTGLVGFDISGLSGTAFASLTSPGTHVVSSNLFRISLGTGGASFVGTIGNGLDCAPLRGLTVVPEPGTIALFALGLGTLAARRRKRA